MHFYKMLYGVMAVCNKCLKIINGITATITMLFLSTMVLLIFIQIISRTLFGLSFVWTEEVARFLMIWVVFLGAGIAFQYGAHISIESLFIRLPVKKQKIIQVIITLLVIIFLLVLFMVGYQISMLMMIQKSPALRIPMGYIYAVIPLSAILQIFNVISITSTFLSRGYFLHEEV